MGGGGVKEKEKAGNKQRGFEPSVNKKIKGRDEQKNV